MEIDTDGGNSLKERTSQEQDALDRSNKRSNLSYRDLLIGGDDGNLYDLQCQVSNAILDDGSDVEDELDVIPGILLSGVEKRRIRAPWAQGIIVKVFGKTVGYSYLSYKINAMWKPQGVMDIVDLGLDYFLIRFYVPADLKRVIQGGPWFIGQNYLTIRQFESGFNPEEATFTHTAVWVRLPFLPIEFYDLAILKRIGSLLSTLVRIDARTANSERGRYARLCIQVDLDLPLKPKIKIGKHVQRVMYEGLGSFCFHCGIVGHKLDCCPTLPPPHAIHGQENASTGATSPNAVVGQPAQFSDSGGIPDLGPWMVVTNRRQGGGHPTHQKPAIKNSTSTVTDMPTNLGNRYSPIGYTDLDKPKESGAAHQSVLLGLSPANVATSIDKADNLLRVKAKKSNKEVLTSVSMLKRYGKHKAHGKKMEVDIPHDQLNADGRKNFKYYLVRNATKSSVGPVSSLTRDSKAGKLHECLTETLNQELPQPLFVVPSTSLGIQPSVNIDETGVEQLNPILPSLSIGELEKQLVPCVEPNNLFPSVDPKSHNGARQGLLSQQRGLQNSTRGEYEKEKFGATHVVSSTEVFPEFPRTTSIDRSTIGRVAPAKPTSPVGTLRQGSQLSVEGGHQTHNTRIPRNAMAHHSSSESEWEPEYESREPDRPSEDYGRLPRNRRSVVAIGGLSSKGRGLRAEVQKQQESSMPHHSRGQVKTTPRPSQNTPPHGEMHTVDQVQNRISTDNGSAIRCKPGGERDGYGRTDVIKKDTAIEMAEKREKEHQRLEEQAD
ncbi:hypothetical protein L1049_000805 [Liquidambar formosana]|uniref:DUF4283 domain-containing protein n=1 Tax=Liquidambar formosana TaxID=63359 RepID=A0AAP0R3F2_LIQFO